MNALRPLRLLRGQLRASINPFLRHRVRAGVDWLGGFLFIAILCAALALVELSDALAGAAITAAKYESVIAQQAAHIKANDTAPGVRLEGPGYECRNFRIRDEWRDVVAQKCAELAGVVRMARASE